MGTSAPDDDPERVPPEVIARAKEAFGQRAEGQLAALVFDSLVDEGAPAEDHVLRFEHPSVQIELRVSVRDSGSTLVGQVNVREARRVQLQFTPPDGSVLAEVTDDYFSFEEVGHGIMRLNLFAEGPEPIVRTDWFRV